MKYAIYTTTTGQINGIFTGNYEIAQLQLKQNQALLKLENDISDDKYYIVNDILIAMPEQPSKNHIFNWTTKTWNDPRTLTDFKNAKWEQIKTSRDQLINGLLQTPFGTFDADPKSQKSITDAIMLLQTLEAMGTPETVDFTLADNTTVTLTTQQIIQVGLLLGQRTQNAYVKGRLLREMIDQATTITAVQTITW